MVKWLCYPPTFTMLPTIIFGKKYCRSSQRAQKEIQEQSSNTEEQELRAMPRSKSYEQRATKHENYNNKTREL